MKRDMCLTLKTVKGWENIGNMILDLRTYTVSNDITSILLNNLISVSKATFKLFYPVKINRRQTYFFYFKYDFTNLGNRAMKWPAVVSML